MPAPFFNSLILYLFVLGRDGDQKTHGKVYSHQFSLFTDAFNSYQAIPLSVMACFRSDVILIQLGLWLTASRVTFL